MRILDSAHRHGMADEDIRHAVTNAIRHDDLDDGLVIVVCPTVIGSLIESGSSPLTTSGLASSTPCPPGRSSSEVTTMPRSARSIIDHADELAARFEAAEPAPVSNDGQAAVLELRDAVVERGRAEARVLAGVSRARAAGVSWSVLAAVLGTSRQAVQQRYGSDR